MSDKPPAQRGELLHCLGRRRAGVLLHITSLPGAGEVGDLGPGARAFVDFMQSAGLSVWQMLPVGPIHDDGSPYQSSSVHAGDPRMIGLQPLVQAGWLEDAPEDDRPVSGADKRAALRQAWEGFQRDASDADRAELQSFSSTQRFWLNDYVIFQALHDEYHEGWWSWPHPLRDREPRALAEARARLAKEIEFLTFEQFLFFRQWRELREYANARDVKLFGDMPIFVAQDSAEVWAHRQTFALGSDGMPEIVAGVPPDYFSATGQRWGNPLYRWEELERDGFAFWVERVRTQRLLFDIVRIDHFRGFEAYWEIPAEEENAVNGRWVKAPGDALFARLHEEFDPLPIVAEDLGVITEEVEALRDRYNLPGMKVLQFAFSGDPDNPYLPYNHPANAVVYTGTHDNDTTLGWYTGLATAERDYVDEFLGHSRELMPWPMIRSALASRADLAIVPMQDLLSLDGEHRMNLPGTTQGNWRWRFDWSQVEPNLSERLRKRVYMYGRDTPP